MADRRPKRRTLVTVALLALLAVVAGFALGFVIATRPERSSGIVAAPPSGTRPAAPVDASGTAAPATDPPAPTTAPTTTGTEPASPSSPPDPGAGVETTPTAAASSSPPSTTTVPVTVAPTTQAPTVTVAPTVPRPVTTLAPPHVEVLFATDGAGRLVIPRTGTATLTIRNTGGLASQWIITGSGFTVRGTAQGTLQPGQSTTVAVAAPAVELPKGGTTGTISVLGAVNPTVAFVIPPA